MDTPVGKSRVIQPQGRPTSDINVTPLVDVVLVLLIIFMVLTPLMARNLHVELPEHGDAPPGPPPQPKQVVVHLRADGQLTLDGAPVTAEEYVPALERLMEARAPRDRLVFFLAEDHARYATLVAAIDGARAAGAETLGMAPTAHVAPDSR